MSRSLVLQQVDIAPHEESGSPHADVSESTLPTFQFGGDVQAAISPVVSEHMDPCHSGIVNAATPCRKFRLPPPVRPKGRPRVRQNFTRDSHRVKRCETRLSVVPLSSQRQIDADLRVRPRRDILRPLRFGYDDA